MRLLHEEYFSFEQLLDELPITDAIDASASYFDERDESDFGLASVEPQITHDNIVSRYFARKGK